MTAPWLLAHAHRVPQRDDVATAVREGSAVVLRELPAPWRSLDGLSMVMLHVEEPDTAYDARDMVPLDITVPDTISGSAPVRRRGFLSGRAAALLALSRHGIAAPDPIGIAGHRGPVWPHDVVGSITHTAGVAAAVVASASAFRGIGLDVEPRMTTAVVAEVAPSVASEFLAGTVSLSDDGAARDDIVTAIFSAKESLFKCLRPLVDDFFDFSDARMLALHLAAGHGRLRVERDLGGGVQAGSEFDVRLHVSGDRVHTLITVAH